MKNVSASIDQLEIDKFSALAEEWWDPKGKLKPLHDINNIRTKYLIDNIKKYLLVNNRKIEDLKILDIGCGGGLLSENFARLGCKVTAIDASDKNISVAKIHSKNMGLEIDYRNTTIENMVNLSYKYDVVLNMEVIEHVNNIDFFIENSAKLTNEEGIMFISTINRNCKSYLLAIIAAEYILKWLPIGTHDYKKFLKPSEIDFHLRKNNLKLVETKGLKYNIFTKKWDISNDIDVNYIIIARK